MDKQALQILFRNYWSASGWKAENQRSLSLEDFAYAKSKGLMFDLLKLDHAEALNKLSASIKSLNKRIVTDGFLSSLSTRRLDWRSALGSYAVFQNLSAHLPASDKGSCNVCGFFSGDSKHDLNILNFERFKWGGVRHDDVVYAAMDLDLFLKTPAPPPTTDDIQIFRNIISQISNSPTVGSAALHANFAKALKSNKAERDVLIAIFGFCGILGIPQHPGFTEAFIPVSKRELPDRHFVDMPYPACWWRGDIGINQIRLNEYFGYIL